MIAFFFYLYPALALVSTLVGLIVTIYFSSKHAINFDQKIAYAFSSVFVYIILTFTLSIFVFFVVFTLIGEILRAIRTDDVSLTLPILLIGDVAFTSFTTILFLQWVAAMTHRPPNAE